MRNVPRSTQLRVSDGGPPSSKAPSSFASRMGLATPVERLGRNRPQRVEKSIAAREVVGDLFGGKVFLSPLMSLRERSETIPTVFHREQKKPLNRVEILKKHKRLL
jgi:hypothetical protein